MIPLSTRMRPDNIDFFVGQEHFMYKNSLFYNYINNAIISRVGNIYEFKRHSSDAIYNILINALNDKIRGLGNLGLTYEEEAIKTIAQMCNGDARIALDTLGFIGENIKTGTLVNRELVSEAMQRQTNFYDKSEDKYNL